MSTTAELLGFIAPLLIFDQEGYLEDHDEYMILKKNTINNALYDDIVTLLADNTVQIEDEITQYKFELLGTNEELYTSEFINSIDSESAPLIFRQILNCANCNLRGLIRVNTDMYNVQHMIERCIQILQLNFIPIYETIDSEILCDTDNLYEALSVITFMPANLNTYDYIKTNCDYAYGLSSAIKTAIENWSMHTVNEMPWTHTFSYILGDGAIAPSKSDFGKVGFTIYATSLASSQSEGTILIYNTELTLIPPKLQNQNYHMQIFACESLTAEGYIVLCPKIIAEPIKLQILIQKIRPDAVTLTPPFAIAKFLLAPDILFIPVEVVNPTNLVSS